MATRSKRVSPECNSYSAVSFYTNGAVGLKILRLLLEVVLNFLVFPSLVLAQPHQDYGEYARREAIAFRHPVRADVHIAGRRAVGRHCLLFYQDFLHVDHQHLLQQGSYESLHVRQHQIWTDLNFVRMLR